MFWDFGSLHQKHRESAGLQVVCVVMDQMVAIASPPASTCTSSANRRCWARRLVQNILTYLGVGSARDGKVVCIQTGFFLSRVCSGAPVRSTKNVAASFSHGAVAAAVTFVSHCGDFGFVLRHKPAKHRIQMFLQLWTLRRHVSRPVAGRRVPPLEKLAGGRADLPRFGPSCSLQSVRLCLGSGGLRTSEPEIP